MNTEELNMIRLVSAPNDSCHNCESKNDVVAITIRNHLFSICLCAECRPIIAKKLEQA